jgi:phosphoglucosamine mutase
MDRLFGTDGIRGIPGEYPLTDGMVFKIGKAVAHLLLSKKDRRKAADGNLKIIMTKDTRLSGQRIEVVFSSGITSYGIDVLLAGIIPTPGLAFLTKELKSDIGVMISASHNRAEENGIKLFSDSGYKLSQFEEEQIEEFIFSYPVAPDLSLYNSGSVSSIEDGQKRYIDFLKSLAAPLELNGLKIITDCAHGALSNIAPVVFKDLGAEVISINDEPNGQNINLNCGALHPQNLSKLVSKYKADIGFSFDGDGDRLILTDEKGNILDGDYIMAIIGRHLLEKDKLPGRTIVTTVLSNYGLQKTIEDAGGRLLRTDVGDRYVVEACLKNSLSFGGEQSGHIVFLDHSPTCDALVTSLQILKVIKETGKRLSELSQCMRKLPQVLINVKVKEKKPFESVPRVSKAISQSESKLNGNGRLLVRYSGTESVCRIMVEGENQDFIEEIGNSIARVIEEEIGYESKDRFNQALRGNKIQSLK